MSIAELDHLAVNKDGFFKGSERAPLSSFGKVMRLIFGAEITNYGFDRLVKKHLSWPKWLPLAVEVHHGWYPRSAPRQGDLKKNVPAILVFNTRQAEAWAAKSSKPVHVLGAPFIHYRRSMCLEQSAAAQGTIVFPVHSGTIVEAKFDVSAYCAELKSLPAEMHPITICLHEDDIKKGRQIAYLEEGFSVYCAGARRGERFAENFYELLRRHKYSSSNGLGSYVLYSVEMGIPFFLLGPSATFDSVEFEHFNSEPVVVIAHKLFRDFSPLITAEQRAFVLAESGIDHSVRPEVLKKLLLPSVLFNPIGRLLRKVSK